MANLERAEYTLRTMARWIAIFAVILSAWLFGSADGWNYLLICQLITVAMILWLVSLTIASQAYVRAPALTAVLLLLTAFVGVQILPLPRHVVEVLNPFSAAIQADSRSVLERVAFSDDQDSTAEEVAPGKISGGAAEKRKIDSGKSDSFTLSICPSETKRSLFLLIAYIGAFVIIANSIRSWGHLRGAAVVFVISGFAMSLLGIIHKFSGSPVILWFHAPRYGGEIFGPFTNPNHFAAHINMLIGVGLGLYLSSSRIREALAWPEWRERRAWLSTSRASTTALSVFAVSLMGGAVCMSLSRGGITSFVAAVGITFLLTTFFPTVKRKARFRLIAGSILVISIVIWLGWRPVIEELFTLELIARNPVDDARFVATGNTLQILGACPWFGSGFGSFSHVFPVFQASSLHFGRWMHAHNDWAELLAEGGIVGTAIFLFAVIRWVRCIGTQFAGIKARAELKILGLTVGFLAIAVHSFWDYSLHKPGNMFLLAALAGLAVAAVYVGQSGNITENGEPPVESGCSKPCFIRTTFSRSLMLLLVAAVVVVFFLQNRALRGELAFSRFIYMHKLAEKTRIQADSARIFLQAALESDEVIQLANDNPDALRETTAFLFDMMIDRRLPDEVRLQFRNKAVISAAAAVKAAPSDYLSWLWLARVKAGTGMWSESESCLERARSLVIPGHKLWLFRSAE